MNKQKISPETIMGIAYGFMESRVLLSAYELGIFSVLGEMEKTSSDIAKEIDAKEKSTDQLMNALVAIGLLNKKEGKFSNKELAAKFLVKGKPGYMANLAHSNNMWKSWGTLTDATLAGTSVMGTIADRDKDWIENFITAMHWISKTRAPKIVTMFDLKNVKKVLDVGGGSGAYSIEIVKTKPEIKATIFDLATVLSLTKEHIKEAGVLDKIDFASGDFNVSEFPKGFDFVLLSSIIHAESVKDNIKLIKKCYDSLNKNGKIVISDFIMNPDRTSPTFGALFALNMLMHTNAGDTYTEEEVMAWMEEAGFVDIKKKECDWGVSLVSGTK